MVLGSEHNRLPEEKKTRIARVTGGCIGAVFVFGLPSIFFLDLNPMDDPLVLGYLAYSAPIAKTVAGIPLNGYEFVAMLGWWAFFLAAAWCAPRWRFEPYAYSSWQAAAQVGALTPEIPRKPGWMKRLGDALRVPYLDLGDGAWALASKNLTALLRFPHGMMSGMMLMIMLAMLGPFLLFGASAGFAVFLVLMLAPTVGMLAPSGVPQPSSWQERSAAVALLPLTGEGYLVGYVLPAVAIGAAWGAFFAGLLFVAGLGALFATSLAAFMVSTTFLGAAYQLMGASVATSPREDAPYGGSVSWGTMALVGSAWLLLFGQWIILILGPLLHGGTAAERAVALFAAMNFALGAAASVLAAKYLGGTKA
jgi:hypothetical protein